jgi:type II secretory pathway component PulF
MSVFAYTAIGRDGQRTAGTLSADTRSAAITQVIQRGLHPVSINEQNGNGAAAAKPTTQARPGRVPQKAVESFTRELANLLSGGVSLARALNLLKREASSPAAKQLWGEIHDEVVGGNSLADSLAKYPKSFSTVYVAMVRAGEAGGFLDVVLAQIAEFRSREQDLKGKVKAALIYPIMLACLATCVVVFLMIFFIPVFSKMFTDMGSELPYLTRIIIGISDTMRHYGLFVVIGLVLIIAGIRQSLKSDSGRRSMERTFLGIPVLGRVIASFAMVRFCRMLGTLVAAGVPLVASLRVAREAIGNQTLSDVVNHAIDEVQRGSALSKALAEGSQLFPPSVIETIAVAEETARLDKELLRVAASYESDLDRQLRMLVAVAEPILLFIMAGVIGTVVVGMLLPIFNLQEIVK